MSRALEIRLRKLEQQRQRPEPAGKWHRIIGDSKEELDAKRAALMASPGWQDGDHTIERLIVDPRHARSGSGREASPSPRPDPNAITAPEENSQMD